MKRAYRAAVSSVLLLVLAAPGYAQSPPPASQPFPGFVSPYEVMRMVHASGFDPLAPPLREGTAYVLRATDFRGILMRVVVDGRTGAFREVTRIVPGPGRYGQFYGGPPYGPSEYDAAMAVPSMAAPPGVESEPPLARPAAVHPAATSPAPAIALSPPLPRPRPAALASRSPVDVKPAASPETAASPKTEATTSAAPPSTAPVTTAPAANTATVITPAAPPDGKPQVNSEVVAAPPPPAAAPKKSTIPVEPLND